MTWSKPKSLDASEQLAWRRGRALGVTALLLVGCAPPAPVASPRGTSYGVERAGHPFNAVTLVDAARGTTRSAHDVLFEGASLSEPDAGSAERAPRPLVLVGLPRGEGITSVDDEALIRDGQLVVIESLVQELRRRGHDVRLDRTSTLALPPVGVSPALRLSVWLDDIVIRRGPGHVDASTRANVWARDAASAAVWQHERRLHTREARAPFDVLSGLGRALAADLEKKLLPATAAEPAGPR